MPFRGPSSSSIRVGAPYEAAALVLVSAADAAGAVESLSAAAAVPQADAAGAAEALAIGLPVADAAGAVEAVTGTATAPQHDAAGAVDAVTGAVTAPQADAAGAADAMAITVGPVITDAAGAADAMTETVAAPQAEVAGAVEAVTFPNPIASAQAEAAGAADKNVVAATAPMADAAGAADTFSVHAAVPSAEVAGAVEAVTFPSPITAPQHDAAGAADTLSVVHGGPSTFISGFPGPGGSFALPPGYQGGPSGAGSIPPSALGNGWEIQVVSGLDYVTLLAVIPATMLLGFQFVRQLNDIGSGTVMLSLDDPWWRKVTLPGGLPAKTLLDEECLWRVYKDGVCRFDFLGETVTEQLVDPSEQRTVTVTGPGTIAVLKWAMVAPQGFPDIVLKLDGLLDSFNEVDVTGTPVMDTNIWTTITPASHVYITPIANLFSYPGGVGYNLGTLMPSGSLTMVASPGTTILSSSPWDFTDTLVSVQMTPVGVASTSTDASNPVPYGTGLDGSEVTQMYVMSNYDHGNWAMWGLSSGLFYAQLGGDGEIVTAYEGSASYDSTQHAYWMITEQGGSGGGPGTFYWWTSPDGQSWSLWWQHVHYWNATNTFLTFAATYDQDNAVQAQITNLNSMVTTPSYQGDIYLGEPLMWVWLDQFLRAQGRGTIPFVTTRVTGSGDSYGRAWSDVQNVQTVNGTDLYSLLQSGTAVVNADYVMDPGFQLRVGQRASGQVALGVDRSRYLILREGHDIAAKGRVRARSAITTLLGGENADGHEISASSPAFIAQWGQREAWFQAAVQVDPVSMEFASATTLAQNETEILSWTLTIVPNVAGKTIFDNFDVGDWVGLERPDFSAVDAVRVAGIAVSVDATGGETHELTLVSYIQYFAQQLTYLADKLGGKFVNAVGTTPVAPSKFGTGQVPTYFTPAATLGRLADVIGSSAGSTMSTAPLVYNPATGNYQHAGTVDPVSGTVLPVKVQTALGSATVTSTTVTVNTGNGSTVIGLQGDGTVTIVDGGGSAPGIPDAPVVTGGVQSLQISWDGLLSGSAPLSNFQYVQVYVGTSAGFVPSGATLIGTLPIAGTLSVTGLTVAATYYVKLVAVTTSGAASAPTAAVSGVVAGLPTAALTGQLPASLLGASAGALALNPNPFFNGGDLTGWSVVNGTLAASGTVPAGAPGHPQFVAVLASTSANCLMTGSTAAFQVTPGQPYAMTAWVYNPSGSAVTVAAGFNWAGGTSTVSCGPTAWTPVTVVMTCPGGVTSAYQVIGPVSSGVTVNVSGAVAAGQVPGQLLAVNSVTANQIAANTITAGQIAANTITASQIAANTITATQIAANTITAAQIAAATITATQIAAGTITAAKLVSGIVVAGIVDATTITGATIIADGTAGEFLAYSGTPATGNLIMSFAAAAGTDAWSNPFTIGLTVGAPTSSSPQVRIIPSAGGPGSQAAIEFTLSPLAFFGNQPNIQALSPSSTGRLLVNGPGLSQVVFRDFVQIAMYSFSSGLGPVANSAQLVINYITDTGVFVPYMVVSQQGLGIGACSDLYGVHPGTGTTTTNPAVQESWQTAGLINGWTGLGSLNGIRYRMLPFGLGWIEIEGDIVNTTATGNSTAATMGSGYHPPASRNRPASWNNPQASNSASAPWVFVDTSGNITITGIQTANKEVFFHIFIPMD